ncbi:MAG: RluA family pseudouridine synthase [Puniceicoccales bacterium]|jgi:23S rRNA pseudouridine1911/1915/1917 synthase|nr:RluA family pseudouridine synthase [Puniceicoccales bacterium]
MRFTVPEGTSPDRADKILAAHFAELSRAQLQRIIEDGHVTLNGTAIDKRLKIKAGDILEIDLPPPPPSELQPADIPLEILFEDKHLLAVNKASGVVTHPGAGTGDDTLAHAALHHTSGKLAAAGGSLRPGIVHRLDKETSGVILLAKTDTAYHALIQQFSEREPDKQYIALVDKCPNLLSGSIRASIDRHRTMRVKMAVREDGKPARTDWAVEERFGKQAARVRCWLHTGRTHQIRVHLSHIGHPLLGDKTYGKLNDSVHEAWPMPRVMLHAERITLPHPVTGKIITIIAPIPQDFLELEAWLRNQFGSQPVVRL